VEDCCGRWRAGVAIAPAGTGASGGKVETAWMDGVMGVAAPSTWFVPVRSCPGNDTVSKTVLIVHLDLNRTYRG
jgi:hypothetical protein